MAIDNLPATDEGRLSGAYIRSLVKQLTSTKPHTTNTNSNDIDNGTNIDSEFNHHLIQSCSKGDKLDMAKPTNQHGSINHQSSHKKQVRRRLHTSRPYQERLLNMAEARKEIVTALKFHRAAMKQAKDRKSQDHQSNQYYPDQEAQKPSIMSSPSFSTSTLYYQSYDSNDISNNSYPPNSMYPREMSTSLIDHPSTYESLNIPLPNQTLGLNLNLQAFTNLDTSLYNSLNPGSSSMSSFFPSSSSTPIDPTLVLEGVGLSSVNVGAIDMHAALDEEEMAKIRSIGEQHQIEWDDNLNLVKSARWLKFLKTVEFGKDMKGESTNDHDYHPFGEFMEFPAWLSANEGFLQQHFEDCCGEEYWRDTSLPWMDIGDIDGMDDEWLS